MDITNIFCQSLGVTSLAKRYLRFAVFVRIWGHQMFAKYSKNLTSISKNILTKNFNSESQRNRFIKLHNVY